MNRRNLQKAGVPMATSPAWLPHVGLAEQASILAAGWCRWLDLTADGAVALVVRTRRGLTPAKAL